jgi:hypothetical protein
MPDQPAPRKLLIPVRLNWALAMLFAGACVFQGWVLPILLLPRNPQWAWLLAPLALLANPIWALVHETFHGSFHPDPRINQAVGRVLSVLHGGVFHGLRFAHLLHHRYNRSVVDRTEVYDPAQQSRARFALGYYTTILGGLYASEVAMSALVLLPRRLLHRLAERRLAAGDPVTVAVYEQMRTVLLGRCLPTMRFDGAMVLSFHGASFWLYGQQAWMLAAALLGRGLLISLNDNAYHYGTPLALTGYGKNLRLGTLGSAWLLHFNYHHAHHRQPHLPWRALPRAAGSMAFDESYWSAILRQLKGPIPVHRL